MANPFAALEQASDADEGEFFIRRAPELLTTKRKKKTKRSRKQRTLLRKLRSKVVHLLQLPKQFIFSTIAKAWNSILNAVASRQRSADLEATIKTLVTRIEALEKVKVTAPSMPNTAVVQSAPSNAETHKTPAAPPSIDPVVEKYQKMMSFGVPAPAVRQKMLKDGVNPDLLFPPEPKVERIEFKRMVKLEATPKYQTPCQSRKPLTITVAAIEEIRSSLKSRPRCTPKKEEIKRVPGFGVSVNMLQELKAGLRKTPRHVM